MSNRVSPIGADYKVGKFGNCANGTGVHLSQTEFGFLGELAAFPDFVQGVDTLIGQMISQSKDLTAFKIASNRWFLACPLNVSVEIKRQINSSQASLIDLTHGRTSLLVSGLKAEWVLSKLYGIDFAQSAFPTETGIATTHHGILTQIYRPYDTVFDLFIFRSLARSFWHTLTRAADDVGYEVE